VSVSVKNTSAASGLHPRSVRNRQAILDAATVLFLERGYLAASIDLIAARAAVSKPTVYRFFADKEALLSEIVLGTLDRTGEPFRAGLPELADTTALAPDLDKLARSYIAMVTDPSVLRLRRLVIGASPQLPELAQAYYQRAPERTICALADTLTKLADRGLLRLEDPSLAASHFAFLVVGQVLDKSLFCGDRPYSDRDLQAQAKAGVGAFLRAYAADAAHNVRQGRRPE
jgi:TetR/AcrR family transcriptional repressor of mexJK operon